MSDITLETDILTPRPASRDLDSDEWPEFQLTNSTVHLPGDSKALVSLLDATENNALVVKGLLEPVPKHLTHLLRKPSALKRTARIELSPVRLYAYGQYSDRSIAIWAAGQSGWFCLKPSRAYRKVYNEMIEAIETLYFIADAYKEEHKAPAGRKKKPPSSQTYSTQEIFEKYAAAKLQDEARVAEAAQSIYKHKDFLLLSMSVGKEGVAWTSTPFWRHLTRRFPQEYANVKLRLGAQHAEGRATTADPGVEKAESVSSESSSLKRKRGRPSKESASDVISIGSSTATTSRTIETAVKSGKQRNATKVAAPTTHERRSRKTGTSTPTSTAASENDAAATPVQDSEDEIPRRAHKGKSILRPKPAKSSKSSKMRRIVPNEDEDGEDDREDGAGGSPTRSKHTDTNNTEHHRRRKRRSNRQDPEDEGIDIPSSHSESESGPMSPQSMIEPIKSPSDVLHELDPIQEDTWVCALDGCTHKVYLASEPDSQRLIREHYALHAYDDDERVQMVKRLKAPSLPVNHLMERVRLQAKNDGFPSSRGGVMGPSGDRFPTITALPVMQRY